MRGLKYFHAGAVVCFAIAFGFYWLAWMPSAVGLAAFGVLFEAVAWAQVIAAWRNEGR